MKKNQKNIQILYEDNHIIVAVKPVNILSQKDRTGDPDILTILKDDIKDRYNKPGNVFLGLVHRLDRPVGGVMVFARTSKAASRLSREIREGRFSKTYLAVVKGAPQHKRGKLEHHLVKNSDTNIVSAVSKDDEDGKKAVLNYSVIESRDGKSLVEVELLTGRSHQIRVQFSIIGCPILGDLKYGDDGKKHNMALWSYHIAFKHPVAGEDVKFKCAPPDEYPWDIFNTKFLA
jgi:23S rRNA pseudouridine1911/1915/1917 synthase